MGKKTRQHPDNPDLFWCPGCKKYKDKSDFYKTKRGIHCYCKECSKRPKRPPNPNKIETRQHPDNDNLFWCPRCKTYKLRSDYNVSQNRRYGIHCYCKPCTRIIGKESSKRNSVRIKAYQKLHKKEKQKYDKKYRKENAERKKANDKRWYEDNKEYALRMSREYQLKNWDKKLESSRKINEKMTDSYIRGNIWKCMKIRDPSEELIETVRQRILMKRNLKQFKQWREQNEPGNPDVQGKQQADESDYEGRVSV